MLDLAIVGGGPGGLMSAWYLKRKLGDLCRVTIYEASDRLGGKIVTRKFDSAPAMYEAGVAEIYDYSMTGPDPLRELIQHFGLQTIPMDAEQVQFGGELLNDVPGMRRKYGAKTAAAIEAFRQRCAEAMSPIEYYEGVGAHDNENPWAYKTAEQVLDEEVEDETAKRFFKVMARSDIATESHNTNGLNALKNYLMDVDGYIGLYSIQNGNEQLIECLQSEVNADIQLNHRVLAVGKAQFVVSIPADFTKSLLRGERPSILIEADASDPSATSAALAASAQLIAVVQRKDLTGPFQSLKGAPPPFDVEVHRLYNPESITQYNIVPGLMGVILTMTLVMMTGLAITRERERGTMENLLAMPLTPLEVRELRYRTDRRLLAPALLAQRLLGHPRRLRWGGWLPPPPGHACADAVRTRSRTSLPART